MSYITIANRATKAANAVIARVRSVRLDRRRVIPVVAVILLGAILLALLATTGILRSGADTIAFQRGNTLYAINSDGSGLRTLAQGNIVSMAWSPDHHQFVYRVAPQLAESSPLSVFGAPDAPGDLYVGSVNGGSAIPITPSEAGISRSDAWWNANGNRLLYRESLVGAAPQSATYIVSQADQPAGIARKVVQENAILPVLSPDGSQLAAEDSDGNVRLGAPGSIGSVVATGALQMLPQTNRPARLLWQPGHHALLYIASGAKSAAALELLPIGGKAKSLGEIADLLDLAFSPDGSRLLLRTKEGFQVWDVAHPGKAIFSWDEDDPAALPWWSPAGGRILVQENNGWQLVDISRQSVVRLVTFAGRGTTVVSGFASWHPAAGSPWNAAGNRFVFVGGGKMVWNGKQVNTPGPNASALYVANPSSNAPPKLIDSGGSGSTSADGDRTPDWTYLDPSTTFLVLS